MQAPRNGWNGTGLAEVFSHTVPRDTYIYPNGSNTTSGSNSHQSGASKTSHSNTRAIAGGVVGGVAGLAIAGALAWLYLRRKRQRQGQEQDQVQLDKLKKVDELAARSELPGGPGAAQLEVKTDRAELDEQRHASELAAAMQGVQSPAEL